MTQNEWNRIKDFSEIEHNDFQSERRIKGWRLKRYLKSVGRDIKHCEKCGIKRTRKNPITIQHKDGNALNNKPENLKILCVRCHQQEDNREPKFSADKDK